ncbi:MAG: hypothetical protein AB1497_12335 [Bacillota bacterium]
MSGYRVIQEDAGFGVGPDKLEDTRVFYLARHFCREDGLTRSNNVARSRSTVH